MSPANKNPRQKERDFQRAVMHLAELSGWETLHVRTSMQQGRYLTATTGTMAKGWPDLVLVHPKKRQLIFAELKSDLGQLRDDQQRVLEALQRLHAGDHRIEVQIWRPKDWPRIEAMLTHQEENAA